MQKSEIKIDKSISILLVKSRKTEKFIPLLQNICRLTINTTKEIFKTHESIKAAMDADVVINREAEIIKNKITSEFFEVQKVSSNGELFTCKGIHQ